ncbi:MAG: PDZ domain-containing protein, partial [Cyclobacteriaceae bacterium]|nr:PDZ domain-containing protein [Cyclobacteriaceae bacterium]
SGGALVNLRGELVGLNTAIISPTGAFAGYSFAVPVSLVQKVYNDLVEFGAVQRALLGIEIRDVNSELAKQENLDVVKGVYVIRIRNGSAAEEAGLEEGDVITAVDGKIVNSTSELQERVALNRPGDKISVTFLRNGKSKTATAILKNTAGTTDVVEVASSSISISGSTFVELTDAEKDKLNLDGGVKVETVGNGKWKEAGLKPGYIITRVDKKEIRDVSNFSGYLQSVQGEGILLEGIYPNGDKAYYGIGW